MSNDPPKLIAYIDEAGCAGDHYDKGSSRFLAIGAAVFAIAEEQKILTLFDDARKERGVERRFKKFSKNGDRENFLLTKHIATRPIRIIQVGLHKPSMAGSFTRSNHQAEYQYLVKFAIERISWLARDSARGGDPKLNTCKLMFSEQKLYPYPDLCNYLNKLQKGNYNCSVEWPYIHEDVFSQPHKDETGIHLADITASAFHKAIEAKNYGMTDDRFQRNLLPILYRKSGKAFGIKLFPRKEIGEMQAAGLFQFLKLIA